MRSWRATPASGDSSTACVQLKIVVLAPMPSAEDQDGDAGERGTADEHPPGELQVLQDHAGTPLEDAQLQRVGHGAGGARQETERSRDRAARLARQPDRVVPELGAPLLDPRARA